MLTLAGLNPGSREYLRASVDYDGISAAEDDRFNLVVQRVRAAGSELVDDQEIYRRVSMRPVSGRFITDVLLESRLVRVSGASPAARPDRSAGGPDGVAVGYTLSNPDGDDGARAHRLRRHRLGDRRHRTVCARRRRTLQPAVHPAAGARPATWGFRRCWSRRACAASATRC